MHFHLIHLLTNQPILILKFIQKLLSNFDIFIWSKNSSLLLFFKPDAFISESSSAPSDRSGPPPEPVPEKIISTKIVTTSGTLGGRKLNLRI